MKRRKRKKKKQRVGGKRPIYSFPGGAKDLARCCHWLVGKGQADANSANFGLVTWLTRLNVFFGFHFRDKAEDDRVAEQGISLTSHIGTMRNRATTPLSKAVRTNWT
jgi:hypothetical protein